MTSTLWMKKVYSVNGDNTHLKMTLYLNFYSYFFNPLLVFQIFLLFYMYQLNLHILDDLIIALPLGLEKSNSINKLHAVNFLNKVFNKVHAVSFDMLLPNTFLHMATEIVNFYITAYICFTSVISVNGLYFTMPDQRT